MRPSPPVLAAGSSLAGALLGALLALQLGVVELRGAPPSVAPPPAVPAVSTPGASDDGAAPGSETREVSREVSPEVLRERRATVAALGVLRRWDDRRARAWTRGDPDLLRPLYTPASQAGRRDVSLLERYAERGWSVRGVHPHVVAAEASTRSSERVRIRVVERYPGVAVDGADGSAPGVATEPAAPGTHVRVVSLVRSPTGWRVARVAGR